jgi:hypothetical protein
MHSLAHGRHCGVLVLCDGSMVACLERRLRVAYQSLPCRPATLQCCSRYPVRPVDAHTPAVDLSPGQRHVARPAMNTAGIGWHHATLPIDSVSGVHHKCCWEQTADTQCVRLVTLMPLAADATYSLRVTDTSRSQPRNAPRPAHRPQRHHHPRQSWPMCHPNGWPGGRGRCEVDTLRAEATFLGGVADLGEPSWRQQPRTGLTAQL